MVINFSRGNDTSSVTSGKGNVETVNYLDNHFFKLKKSFVTGIEESRKEYNLRTRPPKTTSFTTFSFRFAEINPGYRPRYLWVYNCR